MQIDIDHEEKAKFIDKVFAILLHGYESIGNTQMVNHIQRFTLGLSHLNKCSMYNAICLQEDRHAAD